MGNVNTHVNERRKSRSGSGGALSESSDRNRRYSGSNLAHNPNVYDDIGPVDIRIKQGNVFKGVAKAGHRPRATTEVGRRSNYDRQHSLKVGSLSPKTNVQTTPGASFAEIEEEDNQSGGSRGLPTIFKYNGPGKDVYVCGTFNDWKRLPMSRSTKDFVAIVDLAEGEHEYKFLVDGEWKTDECNPDFKIESGHKNNIIRVQKADFNAFEALDMDSEAVKKREGGKRKNKSQAIFGQEVPTVNAFEHKSGPPILPPQLLQVILNKDTPLTCEPTLLPEPNHVMLNHLYALSIKDGVMVLSSTHRYKKKFVTTLLYKPMGSRKED